MKNDFYFDERIEIALLLLGGISIVVLILMSPKYFLKKQAEGCRQSCKPLKVQDIEIGGDRHGSRFYYGLEDGRYLFSFDEDIRIGDEVCECSGKVIKLSGK